MSIPAELLTIPHWVAWRMEVRDGKPTKVPVNPATGGNASSTNPQTWGTYEAAQAQTRKTGIGFVVTPSDPYCGVDIDHCIRDGKPEVQAQAIVNRLKSYTEITVSGEGVRVWVKGRLNRPGRKKHLNDGVAIEFYDCGRFFTVTGNGGRKYPAIEERQDALDALHRELFPDRPVQAGPMRGAALSLSDLDLLTKARAARNGDRFDRLWSGNTSDHGSDDSSADMALLCHLAFWTGKDAGQMDRLFRQSGLYREKWEREDYRLRTIAAALDHTGDIWTPGEPAGLIVELPADPGAPPSAPVVDGRVTIEDLSAEIDNYYEHGFQPGEHPGWDSLANLYRVQRGQWTLITGVPTHGKSTFLDAVICNLIDRQGWRFVICSPENQPLSLHFAQLAEKIEGAPFHGIDRMSVEQKDFAKGFIGKYVVFAKPKAPTIDAVLDVALAEIVENGLDGMVLDPWNTLEHNRPKHMSEGEYIALVLTRLREFAQQHQIHIWLVAHPTKLHKEAKKTPGGKVIIKDDGTELKEWPVADPYDVSGSAHWFNMADHALTVWRPDDGDGRNLVFIHSTKARFRHNGKKGVAILLYDPRTGRFSDTGDWWEHGKDMPQSTPPSATPAPNAPDEPRQDAWWDREAPEIQPEYSPNTDLPAQESMFATSDDEAYRRMHPNEREED